jgi:Ca-activated chloride channel homolog
VKMLTGRNDYLAVVIYDDRVETIYPSSKVNRDRVAGLINGITSDGSTALHGGMMEGVKQALKHLSKNNVSRVLLLSDGLANEGITDPVQIARDAGKSFEKGITITTLGMGADYNENLMVDIARKGHGNYYFIESPKMITRIFEKEFASLMSVVAKDIIIEVSPPAGVPLRRTVGFDAQGRKIEANNIWSGSSSSFLFEMEVPKGKKGEKAKLADIAISYTDPVSGKKVSLTRSVEVTYAAGKADPLADEKVFAQYMDLTQSEQIAKITSSLDKGDNKAAESQTTAEISRLKSAQGRLKSKKLAEDIAELEKKQTDIRSLGTRHYQESEEGRVMKKTMQQKSYDKMSK